MEVEKKLLRKRAHSQTDIRESNERSKKSHSRGERTVVPGDKDTVYRVLCPGKKIGSVIGKSGSIIKTIREDTHATIKIEDSIPGVDERVIIIFSSPTKHQKEEEEENNNNDRKEDRPLCPAQDALFRVHERIIEDDDEHGSDDDGEDSGNVTIRLLVPNNQIGCLLGKGGKIIEKMRNETQAQIKIISKKQLPECALPTDELVQISGNHSVVKKALMEISTQLHENPAKHSFSFSSSRSGNKAYGADLVSSANMFDPNLGMPLSMQWGGGYGAEWPVNAPGYYSGYGGMSRKNDSTGKEVSIKILCPNERVGGVVGKSGSTINQIRKESGAQIKISKTESDSEETEIVVSALEYMEDHVSPIIEALLLLQSTTTPRSEDGKTTTRLLVPSNQIGCLIGKGGDVITEIRKLTRADIRIISKDNLPKCASENDELVQISGETPVARSALIEIASRLRLKALRESDASGKAGSSQKSSYASNQLQSMSSHYPSRSESMSMYPSSYGYQGAAARSSSGGYNTASMYSAGGSYYDYYQGYASSRPSGGSGYMKSMSTVSTLEIPVPKDALGSFLGKGGSNLQYIREISGAKIEMLDSIHGSSDGLIEISGTADQTQAAKSLVLAFIDSGRSHASRGSRYY